MMIESMCGQVVFIVGECMKTKKNNILIMTITMISMLFMLGWSGLNLPSYGASTVMVGQASKGESGSYNQQAGDQTGKEVYVSAWNHNSTTRHWSIVARPKKSAVAKKIAQTVMDACNNEHVGYDRNTEDIKSFYYELKGCGWDASKITNDCETTCTPLIAAAINAAGITCDPVVSASKFITLFKTGDLSSHFTVYTSSAYTASSANLKAGDILITYYTTNGKTYSHGAVVVSGTSSTNNAVAKTTFKPNGVSTSGCVPGKNYTIKCNMNIRYGPSTNYGIKKRSELSADGRKNALIGTNAVLKKGTTVSCIAVHNDWIQIPSGWMCAMSNGTSRIVGIADKKVTVKVGKNYKLKKALYVRTGPSTNNPTIKRSSLSTSAKKCAVSGIKLAKFKKGTIVTCQKKSGQWMKVPSGWICCKPGNVANV